MIVIGSLCMYCGMKDPERELTVDESRHINELLCKATDISDDKRITYKMPSGYRVIWSPEKEMSWNYPIVHIHVAWDTISLSCCGIRTLLKDNVGLGDYLKEILSPLLQEHIEEGRKQMEEYLKKISTEEGFKEENEKMLGILK